MVFYSRVQLENKSAELLNELDLREKAEKKLELNQARLVRIFRSSPSPMIVQVAATWKIVDMNPAFEICYGYTREAVLGQTDAILWAESDQRAAYKTRLLNERKVQSYQCTAVRADGSTFEALVSSELGNDEEDKLVITTANDISELALAQEKMRRSEERFAKAFNLSPLNMTITRLEDGTLLEINEACERVQGFTALELQGKTMLEMGVWLAPADRAALITKLKNEGRVQNYDTRQRRKDGKVIDARLWAEVIEIEGETCILTCVVDVSEEKRRDALLLNVARVVAGQSGEDFFSAFTRHMALSLNADMVSVGELSKEQKIKTISLWREGAHIENGNAATLDVLGGQTLTKGELCLQTEQLTVGFSNDITLKEAGFQAYLGQSMCDNEGTNIGVLSAMWKRPIALTPEIRSLMAIFASRANAELMHLVHDREIQYLNETLELRVRERTAELQRLNSELDSFAYSVSHDLKSPLRSIDGFAHILGERLTGRLIEEEHVLFNRMLASTHRMSNLIADMLALARVSQGMLELETVDISQLVLDILEEKMTECPERKIDLRVEPRLTARCDVRLVRIAIENLVGNALKFTRNQAFPLIEFGLLVAAPGQPSNFFVSDNGFGVNMSHADKLFKPFQRLHTPNEYEGTGIGLATVRRIIERHGGCISGHGVPGAGATFAFHLEPVWL
jgi:PAS domain S-box-containing protein